jgi:2-C-methyl-D-erythritol 4-phosphate cytidylyltransferase
MGEVWAIVVAGGSGSRFGDAAPKQFLELGGLRLIDWALAAAAACDGVIAVLPAAHLDAVPSLDAGVASPPAAPSPGAGQAASRRAGTGGALGGGDSGGMDGDSGGMGGGAGGGPGTGGDGRPIVVAGGPTRSASVRAGLAAVPEGAGVIVVHDAARPLATTELFERVVAAVRAGADGAVPGVPVADTVKRVDPADGRVVETLDRAALRAIQTPQAFDAAFLRRAHEGGDDATDDAALVEAAGGRVVVVDGDRANLKITGPDDLVQAEMLLTRRSL